nr:hypothetical protein CFP56_11493 [Quercus suber]
MTFQAGIRLTTGWLAVNAAVSMRPSTRRHVDWKIGSGGYQSENESHSFWTLHTYERAVEFTLKILGILPANPTVSEAHVDGDRHMIIQRPDAPVRLLGCSYAVCYRDPAAAD